MTKLSTCEVMGIWFNLEGKKQRELAEEFGVRQVTISAIWRRQTHRRVTDHLPDVERKTRFEYMQGLGERHPRAKLTNQQVRDIWFSNETHRALAKRYGMTPPAIHYIRTGGSWAYLTKTFGPRPTQEA